MRLIESLATTEALAEIFSDESVLQAMLDFEVALARAESRLKIIPASAGEAIASAARPSDFDGASLARAAADTGTPALAFVKALTELVRGHDQAASAFVHWGATSQDLCDTAVVLLLKRAQPVLESDLLRLQIALRRVAEEHRHTLMLGRTLLQAAVPTTFGLKAAGWLSAIHRSGRRLSAAFSESLILQFGGAGGTLAALESHGIAVGKLLANELGLAFPEAPWHVHRDRLATLVCACGVLGGALGKMARDISLLMQEGVGEVAEPTAPGRGVSSTMPHKRNPVGCVAALAAANRLPGLVSSFISGMTQEHERGLGGWQAEWPTIASVVQGVGMAAGAMAHVADGLLVNTERMRANLDSQGGLIFSERLVILAKRRGVVEPRKILDQATQKSTEQNRNLSEVLSEMPEISNLINTTEMRELLSPDHYLGAAEEFQDRLLASVDESSITDSRRKE